MLNSLAVRYTAKEGVVFERNSLVALHVALWYNLNPIRRGDQPLIWTKSIDRRRFNFLDHKIQTLFKRTVYWLCLKLTNSHLEYLGATSSYKEEQCLCLQGSPLASKIMSPWSIYLPISRELDILAKSCAELITL
jgi:hypothetical protein